MSFAHKILEASSGVIFESITMTEDWSLLCVFCFVFFAAVKVKTSSAVLSSTTFRSEAALLILYDFSIFNIVRISLVMFYELMMAFVLQSSHLIR